LRIGLCTAQAAEKNEFFSPDKEPLRRAAKFFQTKPRKKICGILTTFPASGTASLFLVAERERFELPLWQFRESAMQMILVVATQWRFSPNKKAASQSGLLISAV
jgi:hypothetical protein